MIKFHLFVLSSFSSNHHCSVQDKLSLGFPFWPAGASGIRHHWVSGWDKLIHGIIFMNNPRLETLSIRFFVNALREFLQMWHKRFLICVYNEIKQKKYTMTSAQVGWKPLGNIKIVRVNKVITSIFPKILYIILYESEQTALQRATCSLPEAYIHEAVILVLCVRALCTVCVQTS